MPRGCDILDQGEVVVLKLPDDFLVRTTDLRFRDQLLGFLSRITGQDDVKVLVLLGVRQRNGCEEYIRLHRRLFDSRDITTLNRLGIVLDQIILAVTKFPKPSLFAGRGNLMPFLLNLGLACDYRLISEDTIYQFPYFDLGLYPKGGSAYFLSRTVGCDEAFAILTSGADISAAEARARGLVQEVVPSDDFENAALRAATEMAKHPLGSLVGIKRLLNHCREDLEMHLDYETRELSMLYSQALSDARTRSRAGS
jgi:2-(1,2-epoxy-1,2-dihydrophenyl)acetyl-CoA isomerase